MLTASLSRIDLNLLVALNVLLEERSVTLAAKRLFITQPAMSKTLQRLRELFDDQLLVKKGRELMPTTRALELQARLPALLGEIADFVEGQRFLPETSKGIIHLVSPEFIAVQVVPIMTGLLAREAPGVSMAVESGLQGYKELLAKGEIDFVLEVERPLPEDYVVTRVGGFAPAVWMRKGHPLARKKLTLDNILKFPFIQYFLLLSDTVSPLTESRFDKTLAIKGLRRHKIMVTDQLMTALEALTSSDCLMLATMDDLKQEGEFYEIVRKPYPTELLTETFIPAVLVQHRRTLKSPLHSWFRDKLIEAVRRAQESQARGG